MVDKTGLTGAYDYDLTISLQTLFERMAEVCLDRANAAGIEGAFACTTHAGSLQATIRAGRIDLSPIVPDQEQLGATGAALDEGALAHLLFRGWDTAVADLLGDNPAAELLRALFPVQDFVVWPADAF